MPSNSLVFRFIGIDDGASAQFDRMAAKADMTKASMAKFAAGTALAFGVVAVESLRMASKFQSSMELIHTQAGVSQKQVDSWSKSLLNLAGTVGTGPEALSEALFHIASTGQRGASAINELKVAAEGAKVGQADLTDVTNALNATIVSGIKGAGNFTHAMGALNAIVGAGDMHMQDLADALGTGVLVTLKTFGVTLTQAGAALAVFGDNNIRGAQAATYLRQAVQSISAASPKAGAALAQVHVTVAGLQDALAKGGLTGALDLLHTRFESSGIAANKWGDIMEGAFTKKAGTGITILLEEFGRYQLKQAEVAEGAKNFGSDWSATTKTLSFQTQRFQADIEALAVKFGTALIPAALGAERGIEGVGNAVAATVRFFTKHEEVTLALAGALGGVLLPTLLKTAAVMAASAWESFALTMLYARDAVVAFATGEATARDATIGLEASLGPIGIALAAFGAIAGATWEHGKKEAQQATEAANAYVQSLHVSTNSVASLQAGISQLQAKLAPTTAAIMAQAKAGNLLAEGATIVRTGYGALAGSLQTYEQQLRTVTSNETKIANAYGLTRAQVEQLAQANGIDLTGSLTSVDNGFQQVITAANLSKSPLKDANANFQTMAQTTTDAATEMTNLGNAFNDLVGNFVGMKQAQVDFKNNLVETIKALEKSHGKIGLNSQASRDAATAYHSLVNSIEDVTSKTYNSSKSLDAAKKAAQGMLGQLEQLPVKGPQVRKIIQGLTKDIAGMSGAAQIAGASVGKHLGEGVVQGLRSQYQAVQSQSQAIIAASINAMKHAGVIQSPSKATAYVGRMLAEGLIGGWTGEAGRIKDALTTPIQNALSKLDSLTKSALSKQNATLKAAQSALKSTLSSRKSAIGSLSGSLAGSADLSNLFGSDANGNPTMGNLGTFLGSQVGPLQQFASDEAWGKAHHLSKVALNAIAQLGASQGDQVFKQLMSGQTSIGTVNQDYGLIGKYSKAAATTVEDSLYAGVVAKDKANIDHQERVFTKLEKTLDRIDRQAGRDVARNVTIDVKGSVLSSKDDLAREIVKLLNELDKRAHVRPKAHSSR